MYSTIELLYCCSSLVEQYVNFVRKAPNLTQITIKSGYWATTDLIFGDVCSHFGVQSFSFLYLSPLGIVQAAKINVGITLQVLLKETT